MRFLNKKDITGVDRKIIQDAVHHGYGIMNLGEYHMPDRTHVQDQGNTLLLMPCFSRDYFATKLVSVFPGASDLGLPVVNGIMTLADNASGQPLALMDGAALTAERTGAVGGLGVALLTGPDIGTAGIIGAGVQGVSQARYLMMNRKIERLMIFDLNPASAAQMAARLSKAHSDVEMVIAGSADDLVRSSELVIAATTSTRPLFSNNPDLVKGKTFISIGSFRPDMKEFPDVVIQGADQVFVDTLFAARESGDIRIPLEKGLRPESDILPFAGLVNKPVPLFDGHGTPGTFFFKSVGMALFDLCVASALYELAQRLDLGVELDF